jgi:hypothetical protein
MTVFSKIEAKDTDDEDEFGDFCLVCNNNWE